jgi:hypothetical protein
VEPQVVQQPKSASNLATARVVVGHVCGTRKRRGGKAMPASSGAGSSRRQVKPRGLGLLSSTCARRRWGVTGGHYAEQQRHATVPGLAGRWPGDGGDRQGFRVGERTGEATRIKSSRWSCRSPQGGAETPLAGAGDGRERPE